MRRYISVVLALAAVFALAGCSKDYPVVPVYGKVYVIPESPSVGQQFTVGIEVKEQGSGFYRGYYTVTVSKAGKECIKKEVKLVDPMAGEPRLEDKSFVLTEKGEYMISCSVSLDTSTPMESGQICVTASTTSSAFQVK